MRPVKNPGIAADELRKLLSVDDSGILTWLSGQDAGETAGNLRKTGYRFVTLHGRKVAAHRIVWAIKNGEWPDSILDHINRNRDDNRIENLRICTRRQNVWNTSPHGALKTKGVTLHKQTGKYQVIVRAHGAAYYLGLFSNIEEAAKAYRKESVRLHGEYAYLGPLTPQTKQGLENER